VISQQLERAVPEYGNVKLLQITDRQFGAIRHFGKGSKHHICSEQLALF